MRLGVLVHGNNHFIVRGPLPGIEAARRLVARWSIIRIGSNVRPTEEQAGGHWQVSTKEFRENLEWAVVMAGESEPQEAILVLLGELRGRNIPVRYWPGEEWEGEHGVW